MALGTLTYAECLLIVRRREEKTQSEMAEHYGMTRKRYGKIEAGLEDGDIPVPNFKERDLKDFEKCVIYRRRQNNLTQEEVAHKVGITRHWLMMMETGQQNCERLLTFWEEFSK